MAKINLGLDVVRRREDGYHDLRMVMQTVRLFDRIRLSVTRSGGVRLKTNLGFLPTDASNHACKAAQMLIDEFGIKEGVFIDLQKHIPVAAGLAGGSSDAAAVLTGRVSAREVTVRLRGGDLQIEWDQESGHVFMTGPAETVFTGEFPA